MMEENDTTSLPATAAKWKYRAIYRVADARVGMWSDEVSITVVGYNGTSHAQSHEVT